MSEMRNLPIPDREMDLPETSFIVDEQAQTPPDFLLSRRKFGIMSIGLAAGVILAGCDSTGGSDPWQPERERQAAARPEGEVIRRRTAEEWEGDAELADDRTRHYSAAVLHLVRQCYNEGLYLKKSQQSSSNSWSLADGNQPTAQRIDWRDGVLTLHASGRIPTSDKTVSHKPGMDRLDYTAVYLVPHFTTARRYLSDMLADPGATLYSVSYINGSEEGDIRIFRNGQTSKGAVENVSIGGEPATLTDVRQRVARCADNIDATAQKLKLT